MVFSSLYVKIILLLAENNHDSYLLNRFVLYLYQLCYSTNKFCNISRIFIFVKHIIYHIIFTSWINERLDLST